MSTAGRIAQMDPRDRVLLVAKSARDVCLTLGEILDQRPLDINDLEAIRNRQRELVDCLNAVERDLYAIRAQATRAVRDMTRMRLVEPEDDR